VGLNVVRRIAARAQGSLELGPREGVGVRATLLLQVAP
jgi:hypothetical protein